MLIFFLNQNENCHHDHFPFKSKGKLSLRSYALQIKRKTVTTIIFLSIQKENCRYHHILFKSKGKQSLWSYSFPFEINMKSFSPRKYVFDYFLFFSLNFWFKIVSTISHCCISIWSVITILRSMWPQLFGARNHQGGKCDMQSKLILI